MKKTEVNKLIQRIKAYYPEFYLQEGAIDEWYKKLEPYETIDVENKLDQHLQGDHKDRPPMLHYITKFLKTPREKAQSKLNGYQVMCPLCNEWMSMNDFNEHYEKCLSIRALQRKLLEKGKKVEYEQIDSLDEATFKAVYKKYMEVNNAKEYNTQISTKEVLSRWTNNIS